MTSPLTDWLDDLCQEDHLGPSTVDNDQTTLRPLIRTPHELIRSVPYLLGFHPDQSIVAVSLCPRSKKIQLIVRVGLDESVACSELAQTVVDYLRGVPSGEILLLLYDKATNVVAASSSEITLPHQQLMHEMAIELKSRDFILLDALFVEPDQWWSYLCSQPECCPDHGSPLSAVDPEFFTDWVAITGDGLIALPDREALAALFTPCSSLELDLVDESIRHAEAILASTLDSGMDISVVRQEARHTLATTIAYFDRPGDVLSPDAIGYLVVALLDPVMRDETTKWDDQPEAENALSLWIYLATHSNPPHNLAPLFLAAWVAWRTGQAALARIAIDKIMVADPEYRVALLLEEALDRGVDPRSVNRSN